MRALREIKDIFFKYRSDFLWGFVKCMIFFISMNQAYGQKISPEILSADFNPEKYEALNSRNLQQRETTKNQKIIQQISQNHEDLKLSIGADFAGSWVEYDDEDRAYQVVAVTRLINIAKKFETDGGTKLLVVKYNFFQLNSIVDIFTQYMQSTADEPLILSSGVDVEKNKVFVRARKEKFNEVRRLIMDRALNADAIFLEPQNGPMRLN